MYLYETVSEYLKLGYSTSRYYTRFHVRMWVHTGTRYTPEQVTYHTYGKVCNGTAYLEIFKENNKTNIQVKSLDYSATSEALRLCKARLRI